MNFVLLHGPAVSFIEKQKNEKDAKAREKFLKSGYGRKQFKEILKNILLNQT